MAGLVLWVNLASAGVACAAAILFAAALVGAAVGQGHGLWLRNHVNTALPRFVTGTLRISVQHFDTVGSTTKPHDSHQLAHCANKLSMLATTLL